MAKKFFRFLRGELNGYYLNAIHNSLNAYSSDVVKFLGDFKRMVFKTSEQVTEGEVPVTPEVLHGLGTFAGVFPPYVPQESYVGSIRFTNSHIAQGNEISDEGLFGTETEVFYFPASLDPVLFQSEVAGRNARANSTNRSTLVEKDAVPVGFFPEGVHVILPDGSIDTTLLVTFEGTREERFAQAEAYFSERGMAYDAYYGTKYLYMAEEVPVLGRVSDDTYLELIKAMQYVRYNGNSLEALCKFCNILCKDYLFITQIDWSDDRCFGYLHFGIDEDFEATDKLMRVEVFKMIAKMKFKQYYFIEDIINVERDSNGKVINITVVD